LYQENLATLVLSDCETERNGFAKNGLRPSFTFENHFLLCFSEPALHWRLQCWRDSSFAKKRLISSGTVNNGPLLPGLPDGMLSNQKSEFG
jgi:hypothetical protein